MDESYILNDEQRNRDPIVQKHNFTHQLSSVTQSCPTLCDPRTAALQASLSITNSQSLLKLMSIESVCHPTISFPVIPFSSCLQSFLASGSFSKNSVLCIRWPKYWSFSFSIHPSNEYSGLISFRMDWLDLLVVQGTLKSLLQHHSSKASVLQHSAFFRVQLSSICD